MLSIVLTASDDAGALSRLLTALVPAVARHVLGDVVVRGATGASLEIAEDAGATLVDGDFAQALARTRGAWIGGLPLGSVLAPGWIDLVVDHLQRTPATAARLTSPGGLFTRGQPEGWLAPRSAALSPGVVEQDLKRLARRGGSRRLRILAGR
jgi:hypothetical protein